MSRPLGTFLLAAALAGCSTTSESVPGVCGEGIDGCVTVSLTNTDPAPYSGATADPDGRGDLILVLVDQCPTSANSQFSVLAPLVVVPDADLTGSESYELTANYRFRDPAFQSDFGEGDTVAVTAALDDNLNANPDSPVPDVGDTLFSCFEFELKAGKSSLAAPLVPCLLLSLPLTEFNQVALGGGCDGYAGLLDGG